MTPPDKLTPDPAFENALGAAIDEALRCVDDVPLLTSDRALALERFRRAAQALRGKLLV